jgi:hypothetical protein
MKNGALDQYLTEKNQADDAQDLIGRLLFELIGIKRDGDARNASQAESLRTEIRSGRKEQATYARSDELDREIAHTILRDIRKEIKEKDIDLSEVVDTLKLIIESQRAEVSKVSETIEASSEKRSEEAEHITSEIRNAVESIGKILEENKPKEVVFDELLESNEAGFAVLGKLIVSLTKTVKEQKYPEKVEVHGEVSLKKPSWWKDFSFSWDPLKEILDPIKALIEKIASWEMPKLPLSKDGRIRVEVDRVGGGGWFGGASSSSGTGGGGDASEATLQAILAALDTVETKLQAISDNTDELEIKADSVNLNTDTLEAKTQEVSDRVGEISATPTANTVQDRLKGIKTVLDAISVSVDGLEANTTGLASETTLVAVRDYLDTVETKLQSLIDKSAGSSIIKKTVALTESGTVHDPESGKKIRIFSIKFSLSATMTDVAFKFAANSAFEKYLTPKAGGLYGSNIHPDYVEGATDEVLNCDITGTGTVQVNIEYVEI